MQRLYFIFEKNKKYFTIFHLKLDMSYGSKTRCLLQRHHVKVMNNIVFGQWKFKHADFAV